MAKTNSFSFASILLLSSSSLFFLIACHPQTAAPESDKHLFLASDSADAASYRAKAVAGDVESQRKLGILYFNATGVKRDYSEAFYWFHKAADQGDSEAEDKLGQICLGMGRAPDYEAAMTWFRKAADQGNAWAERHVGKLYFLGHGVPEDKVEAQVWFTKAFPLLKSKADAGDDECEQGIGTMYLAGWGVKQDYAAAIACHQKAASHGYPEAFYSLAYMYHSGFGVPKDADQAEKFMRQAAELGFEKAQVDEGDFYRYGPNGKEDPRQALYWYQKAADQGDAMGEYMMGNSYENGLGVKQDYSLALSWYQKAAASRNDQAENSIGMLYFNGLGVPQDYVQALEWVKKAFADGNVPAKMNIVLFTQYKAAILLNNRDYDGLEVFCDWAKSVKPTLCSESSSEDFFFLGTSSVNKSLPDGERLKPFRDWVGARPNSVTAKMALAAALVEEAWRCRGNGYANTVTNSGWNDFNSALAESRTILEGIKDVRLSDPQWYVIMQNIALGQGWASSDYFAMVSEGIQQFPDAIQIQTGVMVYLLPRWMGRDGDLLDYANKSADAIGGDDGDILYARLAQAICLYTRSTNVFKDLHFDWRRLSHGMKVMCDRNRDSLQIASFRAFFACQEQDRDEAKEAFKELYGGFDPSVWTSHESYTKCKAWAEY